jgi:hypothetical protein
MALIMSNSMFDIQYAGSDIPLSICMCFRFFDRSLTIWLTMDAGMRANPIEITKTINTPLACF